MRAVEERVDAPAGKGEKTLREGNIPKNTVIFPDLAFAASALLSGD